MFNQYIQPHSPDNRKKIEKLLSQLFGLVSSWSDKPLSENTLWGGFNMLSENFASEELMQIEDEKDACFANSLCGCIDIVALESFVKELENIEHEITRGSVQNEHTQISVAPLSPELASCISDVSMGDSYVAKLRNYFFSLMPSQQKPFVDRINHAHMMYTDVKLWLIPIASALLALNPQKRILNYSEFETALSNLVQHPTGERDDSLIALFRYLGQSFYGRDAEVMEWASDFMMNFVVDEEVYARPIDYLLFVISTHLAFFNFADDLQDVQDILVQKNFLSALTVGVPIENMIKKGLAQESLLPYYLTRTSGLAQALAQNTQTVFLDATHNTLSIQVFLSEYSAFGKDNYLDGYTQMQYVTNTLKQYGIPEAMRTYLHTILSMYIHLNEGDIVDYKGFLSDEGLVEQYNWKSVLDHDMTDEEIKKAKEYLAMVQRPTREKIYAAVAIQSVNWKEEPYLHRALQINSLFEEANDIHWSPLIYFDERENDWKLDKELPDMWGGGEDNSKKE
ncbi:MAG: hypothetical protein WCW16_04145 [Candidatus Magasanikbacteria bacterium]